MNIRRASALIITLLVLLIAAAVASAQERTHTVRPGETLSTIARLYGVSVEDIAFANGITNPDRILAGQVLIIPLPGNVGTTTYTVVAGDTLFSIARRFNTTVQTLAQLNGITDVDSIDVGQVLIVPAQGGTATPGAPTATPQPTGQGGPVQTITYTVRAGDTLGQIALRFGTTYQQIALLNNLDNPDLIYVGQELIIRQGSTGATPTAGAVTGTQAGQTPIATTQATVGTTPTTAATAVPTTTSTGTIEPTATFPPGFSTPTPIVPRTLVPSTAPNLLANAGFEGALRSLDADVQVYEGWEPFYCDQPYTPQKCPALRQGAGNPVGLLMGRPAFRSTTTAFRIHGEASAQMWSCAWIACRGGVYQTVTTTPGAQCEVGAYVQSWSADDSSFISDLATQDDRDNATWLIIVDPGGGTNAYARGLSTSRGFGYADGIYDQYALITYTFTASGTRTTVFFENLRLWPLVHNESFIDDAYVRCGS